MSYMFYWCTSLKELDFPNLNINNNLVNTDKIFEGSGLDKKKENKSSISSNIDYANNELEKLEKNKCFII